jgi:hypothetical protein
MNTNHTMTNTSDTSSRCVKHPRSCHPANATTVQLVQRIKHTTKETEGLSEICATQQVHVRECTAVFAYE